MDDLQRRSGLTPSQFEAAVQTPEAARVGAVQGIAKALGVPEFALYAPPEKVSIGILPDFRRDDAPIAELSSQTYRIIDTIYALRTTASQIASNQSNLRRISKTASPREAAADTRSLLQLDFKDQIEAKNEREFYAEFRFAVERENVFVLQESFPVQDGSGFSFADGAAPAVIVINTRIATMGRRIFTLAHELFHVIQEESGISSVFTGSHKERRCDEFATNFLMPEREFRAFVKKLYPDAHSFRNAIPRIAKRLKVSQQAVALRIDELFIEPGLYGEWLKQFDGRQNPDFVQKKSKGGPPDRDESKMKLSRYGFYFADVFSRAISDGYLSYFELYELSGLKRDYANGYFSYARQIRREDISDDIFGDDL